MNNTNQTNLLFKVIESLNGLPDTQLTREISKTPCQYDQQFIGGIR